MANSYAGTVIKVDTSAAFSFAKNVAAIKYIGTNSTASAALYAGAVSTGSQLWEAASAAVQYNEGLCIRDDQGIYVSVANGAVVYIYLK